MKSTISSHSGYVTGSAKARTHKRSEDPGVADVLVTGEENR